MMVNTFQGPGGARPSSKPVEQETPREGDMEIVGEVIPPVNGI